MSGSHPVSDRFPSTHTYGSGKVPKYPIGMYFKKDVDELWNALGVSVDNNRN